MKGREWQFGEIHVDIFYFANEVSVSFENINVYTTCVYINTLQSFTNIYNMDQGLPWGHRDPRKNRLKKQEHIFVSDQRRAFC